MSIKVVRQMWLQEWIEW